MLTRRSRVLAGTMLLLALALPAGVSPVTAADCVLSAPAYVNVGTELTIEGTGFPATTSIDIVLAVDGGASDAFSVQSDAAGALQFVLVPEDIDIGVTTVQANAGSVCTAQVTFTVLAAGATPPPAQTAEPASGNGGAPTAPGTDISPGLGGGGSSGLPWLLGLALVGAGSTGLYLTRAPRRR